MASLIRKRLQVFTSSTFTDLLPERQAAVEAILTAGHIPAGMELFTAGDESQMDVIKQWIDDSDVFMLILGGRYGSIEETTGKSYTQLEYEYAAAQGKPLFACVIEDSAIEDRVKVSGREVIENDEPQKLKEFRSLVLSKISEFWSDERDIQIVVHKKLAEFARRDDLTGWVRSSESADIPALADEIARLSKENAELRSANSGGDIAGLNFQEMKYLLQQVGLFDFVLENRDDLLAGEMTSGPSTYWETMYALRDRGLVEEKKGTGKYCLTDAGVRFMNQLSLRQGSE